MKPFLPLAAVACALCFHISAQEELPKFLTDAERAALPHYQFPVNRGIETPPPFGNLRNMAEWEEIQALTITWRSYPRILKEITRAAKAEAKVIIFCSSAATVQSYLMGTQPASQGWVALPPLDNMENIDLVEASTNSVWIRDYGANTVYGNGVDTLMLVDWIYNRPRPADDVIPTVLGSHLGINVYTTTQAPDDLVNTGGNFMSDGGGTGFASQLILHENQAGNPYGVTAKNAAQIDAIKAAYQGLNTFVKMTVLPFDGINHIDMHMKILDEETILVGEYPDGIADGPQINANIDFILNNFQTQFNTPFRIVRIPMPDSQNGLWPSSSPAAHYRTYTNGVFVNKTFIYPSYREQYDTTAYRIYSELLPGYNLVPIDCDNNPEVIISAGGAIHCITHAVGVNDPLLIVHQSLKDTEDTQNPYMVDASISHRSGIAIATLHWRLEGQTAYSEVQMSSAGGNQYTAPIPAQAAGSKIQYYINASSASGKTLSRPITAPEGYWQFKVLGDVTSVQNAELFRLSAVYPNPGLDIISIPVFAERPLHIRMYLTDLAGRYMEPIFQGEVYGDRRISHRVGHLATGMYMVVTESGAGISATRLVVNR